VVHTNQTLSRPQQWTKLAARGFSAARKGQVFAQVYKLNSTNQLALYTHRLACCWVEGYKGRTASNPGQLRAHAVCNIQAAQSCKV
jgi:hypothetical protein